MKPSNLQTDIYSAIENTSDSLIVAAAAGSGKTTTTVNGASYLASHLKVIFLAFNRSIVDELKPRIPSNAVAKTFNSFGYLPLFQKYGRITLDKNKTRNILKDRLCEADYAEFSEDICRLIGLAKSYCLSPHGYPGQDATAENFKWLIDRFGINISDERIDHFIRTAKTILEAGINLTSVIDYDDQLYLPVVLKLKMQRYDVIFVDEAQDVSTVKMNLIIKSLNPDGRVIAVGDKNQAINGFTGSDEKSMSNIKLRFECKEFPLSITYRCAKNIVHYANQYVKDIQAADNAPDGTVSCWNTYNAKDFRDTDLVMCRNTAPILSFAFACIARRIQVHVLGREIGTQLIALIDRLDAKKLYGKKGLMTKLEEWKIKQIEILMKDGQEDKADSVHDRYSSIVVFIDNSTADTIPKLKSEILDLFKDKDNCMTLCTCHKSKGLEAPRAFILNPELMPSQWAKKKWAKDQETNLIYVACTRAKKILVFIRHKDFEISR